MKKQFTADGRIRKSDGGAQPYYKDMKGRKLSLIFGFTLCLAAFAMVLAALLIFFVPGISFNSESVSPMSLNLYLYGIGAGSAFVGVIMAVAGANTAKGLARLSFFFGVCAFIAGFVMLIISLFFKTVLPIDALRAAFLI